MQAPEISNIIKTLNKELSEYGGSHQLTYSTNGYIEFIEFNGQIIWSTLTSDPERIWLSEINEFESFDSYIRRVFNEFINDISNLKLKE